MADAKSLLPEGVDSSIYDETDVVGDIATYCIFGKESFVCSAIDNDYSAAKNIPAPKKILASQQTDTYSRLILKLV